MGYTTKLSPTESKGKKCIVCGCQATQKAHSDGNQITVDEHCCDEGMHRKAALDLSEAKWTILSLRKKMAGDKGAYEKEV